MTFAEATGYNKLIKLLDRSKEGEKSIEEFKKQIKQFQYIKNIGSLLTFLQKISPTDCAISRAINLHS